MQETGTKQACVERGPLAPLGGAVVCLSSGRELRDVLVEFADQVADADDSFDGRGCLATLQSMVARLTQSLKHTSFFDTNLIARSP